jgi:hypothetical protein
MQSEDEGYTAMANTLRKDPRQLRAMLLARRKDLTALLGESKKRKDRENTQKLSASLGEIDEALARLVLPAAAKLVVADLEEFDENVTDDDDLDDEVEDADEPDDEATENDVATQDPQEEAADAEETEPENPVAMNSRLRKEMGDSSADFLDDYGLAIHKKVIMFFESLMTKALDLGEEDDTDGESSLREVLRDEVGKRGIRRIEPVFEEWRGAVIKQIAKDVADMFKPPEPEVDENVPEGQEGALPAEGQEAAPEAPTPVASSVSLETDTTRIAPAVGRVSFAVKAVKASALPVAKAQATDFKPSGFTTPRLD